MSGELPDWYERDLTGTFKVSVASVFLLHGDIHGLFPNPDADTEPDAWLRGLRTAPLLILCLSDKEAYLDRYAALFTEGETSFTEPARSRDHTERFLMGARVPFERSGTTVRLSQCDELELEDIYVPADPSSAAFFVTAAAIIAGSRIVLRDVGLNWTRTAFFQIARRMGASSTARVSGSSARRVSPAAPTRSRSPPAPIDEG